MKGPDSDAALEELRAELAERDTLRSLILASAPSILYVDPRTPGLELRAKEFYLLVEQTGRCTGIMIGLDYDEIDYEVLILDGFHGRDASMGFLRALASAAESPVRDPAVIAKLRNALKGPEESLVGRVAMEQELASKTSPRAPQAVSSREPSYGKLQAEGARGRQVATWRYRSAWLDRWIEVEIRLENSKAGLEFVAKSSGLANPVRGPDIEKLRADVEAAFEHQEACRQEAGWEDWLEVMVDGGSYPEPRSTSSGLTISVKPIKRGIDPKSGEPITISQNLTIVPFPKPEGLGEPRAAGQFSGWTLESGPGLKGKAYIPDTPQNRAALDDLQARLDELRLRLGELLDQGRIESSLQVASQMLPALEPPTQVSRRKP